MLNQHYSHIELNQQLLLVTGLEKEQELHRIWIKQIILLYSLNFKEFLLLYLENKKTSLQEHYILLTMEDSVLLKHLREQKLV